MKIISITFVLLITVLSDREIKAKNQVSPPDDPQQLMTYWKPFVVSAKQDDNVAIAHEIFQTLLRTWDDRHISPTLKVVKSTEGPWAASLEDNNILLSYPTLKLVRDQHPKKFKHRLAFILAHELAHQRSNDLWHRKFFRLAGSQSPEVREQILRGISEDTYQDLEKKEAQADSDAIQLMAIVGFDPHAIIDGTNFFSDWVEVLWKKTCGKSKNPAFEEACFQAVSRGQRAKARLQQLSQQTILFELGVQAYIVGQFETSRRYFELFGRNFPDHIVFTNIALTYLMQAQAIRSQLKSTGKLVHQLAYPMFLQTELQSHIALSIGDSNKTRDPGNGDNSVLLKMQLDKNLSLAIDHLKRAIRINPNAIKSYHYLTYAYLMNNQPITANGLMKEKYIAQFGSDTHSRLSLAIIDFLDNKIELSRMGFNAALTDLNQQQPANQTQLTFYLYDNLSLTYSDKKNKKRLWKKLAKIAKISGDSVLFRLAVSRLKGKSPTRKNKQNKIIIDLPTKPTMILTQPPELSFELWVDGEKFIYERRDHREAILDKNKKILTHWSNRLINGTSITDRIHAGDAIERVIKTYGPPDRFVDTSRGAYLHYADAGFTFYAKDQKLLGWFKYRE